MQCFIITCVISLQRVLFGYSLAFGPDTGWGIIGGLKWAGLNFVGGQPNAGYVATIPHQAFMIIQAMFAVITPALIIGAFAERIKFSASYSKTMGLFNVGGYICYSLASLNKDAADRNDFQELCATVSLNTLLTPTLTVYKEIDHYRNWYFLLGISHFFELNKIV
jgi:ammonia channel protein AmtB